MLNTVQIVTHRLEGQLKVFMNVKLYFGRYEVHICAAKKLVSGPLSWREYHLLSLKINFTPFFFVVFKSGINFLHCRLTMLTRYKPDILQTKAYLPVLLNLYLLVFKLFCACIRITYFIHTFFFLCFFSRSLQTLVESF